VLGRPADRPSRHENKDLAVSGEGGRRTSPQPSRLTMHRGARLSRMSQSIKLKGGQRKSGISFHQGGGRCKGRARSIAEAHSQQLSRASKKASQQRLQDHERWRSFAEDRRDTRGRVPDWSRIADRASDSRGHHLKRVGEGALISLAGSRRHGAFREAEHETLRAKASAGCRLPDRARLEGRRDFER